MGRFQKEALFFSTAVLAALLFASIAHAATVCSYPGTDTTIDGLSLTGFEVTAPNNPPADGDDVTVKFSMRNDGKGTFQFYPNAGMYISALTSSGEKQFAYTTPKGGLPSGQTGSVKTSTSVNAGRWEISPAYLGQSKQVSPAHWHACTFDVASSSSDGKASSPYNPTLPASNPQPPTPKIAPPGTPEDSDGDGVVDSRDRCPRTPHGSAVFRDGCRCKDTDGGNAPNVVGQILQSVPQSGSGSGGAGPASPSPFGESGSPDAFAPGEGGPITEAPVQSDSCDDSQTMREWMCGANDEPQSVTYRCAGACEAGVCACVDSDHDDKFTKGTVGFGIIGGGGGVLADECLGANHVTERLCTLRGAIRQDEACPTVCEDGACARPLAPIAVMTAENTTVPHGTSLVVAIDVRDQNPDGWITAANISWQEESRRRSVDVRSTLAGDPHSLFSIPGRGAHSISFPSPGMYHLVLNATNNFRLSTVSEIDVTVLPKAKCTHTGAIYYPSDAICQYDAKTGGGGRVIEYNTEIGACAAVEVCSPDLDYLPADAEECCNARAMSRNDTPHQTRYPYNKTPVCDGAITAVHDMFNDTMFTPQEKMKACKATYLVGTIGSGAVYMKDYFQAELCCANSDLCEDNETFHYRPEPWPKSNIIPSSLRCEYTDWGLWKESDDGYWHSDVDMNKNNIAVSEIPAHASVNVLNTGTCVDYAMLVTTALRKAGYGKDEIFNIRAPGHVYNAFWPPGAAQYMFIDTTGNTGGDFFTGKGWNWTSDDDLYTHCSYDSDKCSNDLGMRRCPAKSMMAGCTG